MSYKEQAQRQPNFEQEAKSLQLNHPCLVEVLADLSDENMERQLVGWKKCNDPEYRSHISLESMMSHLVTGLQDPLTQSQALIFIERKIASPTCSLSSEIQAELLYLAIREGAKLNRLIPIIVLSQASSPDAQSLVLKWLTMDEHRANVLQLLNKINPKHILPYMDEIRKIALNVYSPGIAQQLAQSMVQAIPEEVKKTKKPLGSFRKRSIYS